MLSEITFSMAIIFTSPGVAITREVNMADKKEKIVLVCQVLLTSQRCRIVIVCFRGGMTNYHIGPYRTTSDPIGLKWYHIGPHRPELTPHRTISDNNMLQLPIL